MLKRDAAKSGLRRQVRTRTVRAALELQSEVSNGLDGISGVGTLGLMNEMAISLRYEIADTGGLSHCGNSALDHHLDRSLRNRGGDVYSIELVAQPLTRA